MKNAATARKRYQQMMQKYRNIGDKGASAAKDDAADSDTNTMNVVTVKAKPRAKRETKKKVAKEDGKEGQDKDMDKDEDKNGDEEEDVPAKAKPKAKAKPRAKKANNKLPEKDGGDEVQDKGKEEEEGAEEKLVVEQDSDDTLSKPLKRKRN